MPGNRVDILVIGGGIAGVSVAAECAAVGKVLLLEMEAHPGSHSTGRSAAFFSPAYGNAVVRGLTEASEPFYRAPPEDHFSQEILRPRDAVFVARQDQRASLAQLEAEIDVLRPLAVDDLAGRIGILQPDYVDAVLCDETGGDLDVDLVLQGYLRRFKARGGVLDTHREVVKASYANGLWQVETDRDSYEAPIAINAAGAWADTVAERAGLAPLGIEPFRRTAILVDPPPGIDIADWPLVVDADEEFYFKPDAGLLMLSPADETPTPPCDAQADEWDIAVAVERVTQMIDLPVRRINHRWAGLRTFAPDKTFVAGEDPRAKGFFWLAGQGGYGVQAAPGLAVLACHLVTGASLEGDAAGVDQYIDAVDPARLL